MRTTLTIDDDILQAARSIAQSRGIPLGRVVSDLARKGIERADYESERNGLPIFGVRENAPVVTPEQVDSSEDEF